MKDKAILIDLDGTIYKEKQTIEGAQRWVSFMQEQEIPHLFVTNNAMRSPELICQRLDENNGIQTTPDHIYTSVDATTYTLNGDFDTVDHHPSAYVIGKDYLKKRVSDLGFKVLSGPDDVNQADTVIVGLDQEVSYPELANACIILEQGATFYLTNPDIRYPSERGFVPGAGTLGHLIEDVSDVAPIVCGKPSVEFMNGALDRLGVGAGEAVMIGDNLETDILAANNAHVESILIETGVNTHEDCEGFDIYPTHWVHNYEELEQLWKAE